MFETVFLSRIQFAMTIAFHYIFPPMSIGLSVILVIMEGLYLKTKNPIYHHMTRFWVRIFGLIFAMGVATGIVMEFQFGTNWATYSRYVGDIFGSPLAAEAILAFFLESTFLGVLLFGWDRITRKMHFFSTLMVALGAHLSAVWIIIANSWQQTPVGFKIVGEGASKRAEITDFWAVVFNPSSIDRLSHTLCGAWAAGAFLVISISAYYILRKKHLDLAQRSMKIAIVIAVISSLGQLATGHTSAIGVAKNQPAKLAAFEAHYEAEAPGDLYLFGWVDERYDRVRFGLALPKFLSFLVHFDFNKPVTGLWAFPRRDWPPVNIVFQSYHAMVAIGMGLIGLSLAGAFFWWRNKLFDMTWLQLIFVPSFLGPQIANQLGWVAAEVGRQPWVVYGVLRTSDAVSKAVPAAHVMVSLVLFGFVYSVLFILFAFLMVQKISEGPQINGGQAPGSAVHA
ncbi:cytochrome ubiquinol oxidase subunit I [Elusimicrobiota bacterium]